MSRQIKFRWWNGVRMIPHESLMVGAKNLRGPEHMQFIIIGNTYENPGILNPHTEGGDHLNET